jgi:hypothetical protein
MILPQRLVQAGIGADGKVAGSAPAAAPGTSSRHACLHPPPFAPCLLNPYPRDLNGPDASPSEFAPTTEGVPLAPAPAQAASPAAAIAPKSEAGESDKMQVEDIKPPADVPAAAAAAPAVNPADAAPAAVSGVKREREEEEEEKEVKVKDENGDAKRCDI